MPLGLMFIDYNEAFDLMKHWAVWEVLKKQGVNKKIVGVLQDMYNKITA